jgi:hypothetical protein
MARVLPSKDETAGVTTEPVAANPFTREMACLRGIKPLTASDPNGCSNLSARTTPISGPVWSL